MYTLLGSQYYFYPVPTDWEQPRPGVLVYIPGTNAKSNLRGSVPVYGRVQRPDGPAVHRKLSNADPEHVPARQAAHRSRAAAMIGEQEQFQAQCVAYQHWKDTCPFDKPKHARAYDR